MRVLASRFALEIAIGRNSPLDVESIFIGKRKPSGSCRCFHGAPWIMFFSIKCILKYRYAFPRKAE